MTNKGLLAPLRSPDYRRLWLAQFVSVIGDKVHQIAMSILVYQVTGSIAHVGLMLAVTTLPAVLFGVVAGAYADRWDRRATMLLADVLRAGIVVSIPWLLHLGMPYFYAAAFAVSTVSLLFEPARLAIIPEVVQPDELMAANSLDNVTTSVSELLGLAFGATLVAAIGSANAFYFDSVTFLVSAAFVWMVRYRGRAMAVDEAAEPLREQVLHGVRHIGERPALRDLILIYTLAALGVYASITAMYGLGLERFGSGAEGGRAISVAILDGGITAGLLVGGLTVGQSGTEHAGRKFLTSLLAFGAILALVAFVPTIEVALPLLFLGGVVNMWFFVPSVTIIQTASARHLLGRVFAVKNAAARLATTLGLVAGGLIVEQIGLTASFVSIGGAVIVVAGYGWSRRALREA